MAIDGKYIVLCAIRCMQTRGTLIPLPTIPIRHSVTHDVRPAQKVDAADLSTRGVRDLSRDEESNIAPAMTIERRRPRMVGSAAERPLLAAVDALLDGIEIQTLDTRIEDSHGASRDVDVVDGASLKTTTARIPLEDGAVVVAAAGDVSRRDQDGQYRIAASLPAAANDLISVVALQQGQDGLAVADFSLADISAPGVNTSSVRKGGGLIASSGTSVATPHMAGLLAPWWQGLRQQPTLVNARLVSGRLLASAGAKGFAPEVEITDRGVGVAGAPR